MKRRRVSQIPVDWRVCFCSAEVLLAAVYHVIGFHDLRGNSEVGLLSRGPRRGIELGELFLCRTLAMLTTLLAALAAWDDMMTSGRLMKAVVEVRVMESFPS
jgi:hypothetical protein